MSDFLAVIVAEFRRTKKMADGALAQLDGDRFFARLAPHANSAAIVVKHVAGNLRSRWTDFLTTDGEKPDRGRDNEFALGPNDTRGTLLAAWESSWAIVFASLESLRDEDLTKTVTIRGEPHTVPQALIRSLTHTAYHTGQLAFFGRALHPDADWLTIPPGMSETYRPGHPPPKPSS